MKTATEKLLQAKNLIKEVEDELIDRTGFCPYEIGYTLRNIDDAIIKVSKTEEEKEIS